MRQQLIQYVELLFAGAADAEEIKQEILRTDTGNHALKVCPEIMKEENEFIANYNPVIYCNDLTGESWCYDTKLPSGRWLENITPTWGADGTRIFRALIWC